MVGPLTVVPQQDGYYGITACRIVFCESGRYRVRIDWGIRVNTRLTGVKQETTDQIAMQIIYGRPTEIVNEKWPGRVPAVDKSTCLSWEQTRLTRIL